MFRKLIFFYLIVLLSSCGKDVVIIDEPIPQEETDETFEVNLVGFTTDENKASVTNSTVFVDGQNLVSDESGFFHFEKILIGQKGKVVNVESDMHLPTFYRLANHQSLERVMMNLELVNAPAAKMISITGGSIVNEDGVMTVGDNVVNEDTDFIFQSFVGSDVNKGNSDQLLLGNETEYLLKESSIYVFGSSSMKSNAQISIALNTNKFNSTKIDELSLFHYDEVNLIWEETNIEFRIENNEISFPINEYGWWTIAKKVPAIYAKLSLSQEDGSEINDAETLLSFESDSYSGAMLYTSSEGYISTYFPSESSITVALNNGQYKNEFSSGFNSNLKNGSIEFLDEIQASFDGIVYACDFTLSDGFVAIISEGQHKIREIENGHFNCETFIANDDVVFQFYSKEYDFLSSQSSNVETLKSNTSSFFSCADLNDNLSVTIGANLLQDFDQCRVKVRPNETVVIGERSNQDVFLVSFDGASEGEFEGLIYFPEITDVDVKADVIVNIVLYDEIENKLGGFIKTKYVSSEEELIISFIGNIE